MSSSSPSGATRFASCPRLWSWVALVWVACLSAWCLTAAFVTPEPGSAAYQGGNDLQLYRRIVERVHDGEGYYDAAAVELRERGYPTASLFNWRFPIYAWLLGAFPGPQAGRWVLVALSCATLFFAFKMCLAEAGPLRAVFGALVLIGVLSWSFDGDAFFAQELWAGVLLFLSVCALALERRVLGVFAGVLALFVRELAGPYVLVCAILAIRGRRRIEATLWLVGLVLYGCLLGYHATQVYQRLTPADRVGSSWLQWGGASFVLDTVRMNEWLFKTPTWVRAIYLPLALLGLLGWRGETGLLMAVTAHGYCLLFAAVGQPFNVYWGLLDAPLLAVGIVAGPPALRDLARRITASGAV